MWDTMRQTMIVLLLAIAWMPLPASANWHAMNSGQGLITAGVCTSNGNCAHLQCLDMEGGGVYWLVGAPEPDYSPESTKVRWVIDGEIFTLSMSKAGPTENGTQTYEAAFDVAAHADMVRQLQNGSQLTIGSKQFGTFTVTLRGSGAALAQTIAACPAIGSATTLATPASEPMDAVRALMDAQGCEATESQIVEAITTAGFGIWDANQFIAIGAESGALVSLDSADGEYAYRLSEC